MIKDISSGKRDGIAGSHYVGFSVADSYLYRASYGAFSNDGIVPGSVFAGKTTRKLAVALLPLLFLQFPMTGCGCIPITR